MSVTYGSPYVVSSGGGQFDSDYVMADQGGVTSASYYGVGIKVSGSLGKFKLMSMFLEWCAYFKHHYNPVKVASHSVSESTIGIYKSSTLSQGNQLVSYSPLSTGYYSDVELDVSSYSELWIVFYIKNYGDTYHVQQQITPGTLWKVSSPAPSFTQWYIEGYNGRTVSLYVDIENYVTYTCYYSLGSGWVAMSGTSMTVPDDYEGIVMFECEAVNEDGESTRSNTLTSKTFYAVPSVSIGYSKDGNWTYNFYSSTTNTTSIIWYIKESGGSYSSFSTSYNPSKTFTKDDAEKTFYVYAYVSNSGEESATSSVKSFTLPKAEDPFVVEYLPRSLDLGGLKTNLEHSGGVQ